MRSSHAQPRRHRWWPWSHRAREQASPSSADEQLALPPGHEPDPGSQAVVLSAHGVSMAPIAGEVPPAEGAGIEVEVTRGTVTALISSFGSSASALLHVLGGLSSPESGSVRLEGRPVAPLVADDHCDVDLPAGPVHRARLGLLFPEPLLVPTLTVRQNMLLPSLVDGLGVSPDRFHQVVLAIGPTIPLDDPASQLSRVQQRRVALARVLLTDPAVILAEEPSAGLDVAEAQEILLLLRTVAGDMGRTVVLSTADPDVAAHADHVLVLRGGRIVGDLESPSSRQIRSLLTPDESPTTPAGGSAANPAANGKADSPADDQAGDIADASGVPDAASSTPGTLQRPLTDEPEDVDHALPSWGVPRADSPLPPPAESPVYDDDPRTQEIALMAVAQVRAINQAAARSAATHDPLREELGAEAVQASLNRMSPSKELPQDSARVVDQAQRILSDLPGSVIPAE